MTGRMLRRGSWSVQEKERLRDLFPRHGVRGTAELLRRTEESVRRKAVELLESPLQAGGWTAEEDLQLRWSWGALDPRLLGQILGRSLRDVVSRVAYLRGNLRSGHWTRSQTAMLKELYGTRTDEDLEICLVRPRGEIATEAVRLCLAKDKRFNKRCRLQGKISMPRWTEQDVSRLREIYPYRENLEVARMLGRSVASVANKASQMHLGKDPGLLARIGRQNVAQRYRDNGSLGS